MVEFKELTDDELNSVNGGNMNNLISCLNMNGANNIAALNKLMEAVNSRNLAQVMEILNNNKNLMSYDAVKACSQYLF